MSAMLPSFHLHTVLPRPGLVQALVLASVLGLGACDSVQQQLGIESQTAKTAQADGKAVGGACRQSGRAIEDCYSIYSWLPRAAVYDGWREMDGYMRENKLETVEPQLPPVAAPTTKKAKAAAAPAEDKASEDKAAKAGEAKH
jgi:D-serine dehydratase